jgi:hypothetical protein
VRNRLFVSILAAMFVAVPAALAATTAEPSAPATLPKFEAFDKDALRAFRKEQRRRAAKRRQAVKAPKAASVPPQLEAIAQCESHGNPRAVSASGTYRGKYQFSTATWQAVGGKGDPAAAPESEQDHRAALLYARSGPGQWPVCGS